MERFILTDAQWAKMEAVLRVALTGSPWRDLLAMLHNWSTACRRFRDFKRIFGTMSVDPDMDYAMNLGKP